MEGLLSLGFNITYLLCNSCLIKVSDTDESSSPVNRVARLFYSTYVTSGKIKQCFYDKISRKDSSAQWGILRRGGGLAFLKIFLVLFFMLRMNSFNVF